MYLAMAGLPRVAAKQVPMVLEPMILRYAHLLLVRVPATLGRHGEGGKRTPELVKGRD